MGSVGSGGASEDGFIGLEKDSSGSSPRGHYSKSTIATMLAYDSALISSIEFPINASLRFVAPTAPEVCSPASYTSRFLPCGEFRSGTNGPAHGWVLEGGAKPDRT